MIVEEIMTRDPATCRPDTPLAEVARMMVARDCGCIPVVERDGRPVGVITDRDIVCRAIAADRDTRDLVAADCMTEECVTITSDCSDERCCEVLEEHQIRRAIVVDDTGRCSGIVAQADLARHSELMAGEVVARVSRPTVEQAATH